LLIVGLGLALVAVLLYLQNPEPQPLSDPAAGGGQIEAEAPASDDPASAGQSAEEAAAPTQQADSPQADTPQTNTHQAEAPQTEAPQTEAPQTEAPQAEALEDSQPSQERDSVATSGGEVELGAAGAAEAPAATDPAGQEQGDALTLIMPTFDIVRVEKDGSTLIAGRATPGAEVEVLTGADRPLPGTAVEADGRGEFVALPDEPLSPGDYELRLRSRLGPDGGWLVSEQSVLVVVPERRAVAEADGGPDEGGGQDGAGGVMTVLLSDQPGAPARVMQSPEGLGISSGDLALEIIDYDADGNLIIAGKAPPNARLFVYLDDEGLADTLADAAGRWNAIPADPVPSGAHRLRVDQIGQDGKVIARVETQFYRAPGDSEMAASGEVKVEPGNSLWRIARRTYGRGIRYTLIYQANKQQIRDPDLIYPGQIFILPEDSTVTQ
jgi:nucleoid-associated protein YgaU